MRKVCRCGHGESHHAPMCFDETAGICPCECFVEACDPLEGRVEELERIVEQLRGPPAKDESMCFKRIENE